MITGVLQQRKKTKTGVNAWQQNWEIQYSFVYVQMTNSHDFPCNKYRSSHVLVPFSVLEAELSSCNLPIILNYSRSLLWRFIGNQSSRFTVANHNTKYRLIFMSFKDVIQTVILYIYWPKKETSASHLCEFSPNECSFFFIQLFCFKKCYYLTMLCTIKEFIRCICT